MQCNQRNQIEKMNFNFSYRACSVRSFKVSKPEEILVDLVATECLWSRAMLIFVVVAFQIPSIQTPMVSRDITWIQPLEV